MKVTAAPPIPLAETVASAGTVITGATLELAYAPAAPRAARSLDSTRAPASAGLSPWLFVVVVCIVLAGLDWLGRRLNPADASSAS